MGERRTAMREKSTKISPASVSHAFTLIDHHSLAINHFSIPNRLSEIARCTWQKIWGYKD